jgi:hypothetical protein
MWHLRSHLAIRPANLQRAGTYDEQPQAPPQQPPPEPIADPAEPIAGPAPAAGPALARPASETVDNSLTVSACPCGQSAGSPAALMGRSSSKVSPQARQRNSYLGMRPGYGKDVAPESLPDDLQRPLDESTPVTLRPAVSTDPDANAPPTHVRRSPVLVALGRVASAPWRALRGTARGIVRLPRGAARLLRGGARALSAWSRRPSGRLALPGLLIVVLVGAAGAAGNYLVPSDPSAAGPPGPTVAPTAPTQLVPGAPTAPPISFPTADGTVGPGTPGIPGFPGGPQNPGARAEALRDWAQQMSSRTGIPPVALQAYGYAELVLTRTLQTCQLSWTTLAAIGRVESNHGSSGGAALEADGRAAPPIMGAPLDGAGDRALILDTDSGALDGDTVYDRAVGPMQFIPQTWQRDAVDATGDGIADVHNINDAALAAANYLCRAGGNLTTADGWWRAVLAYNDVQTYAEEVFDTANEYGRLSRS